MTDQNKLTFLRLPTAGQSSVGKTSLLERFNKNVYDDVPLQRFRNEVWFHNDLERKLRVQLWDTAGQERFHCITKNYFLNSDGITLVYDITDRRSFEKIQDWINIIRDIAPNFIPVIILMGNKCDLKEQRQVPYNEGLEFANSNGFLFIETSAKSAENVNEAYNLFKDEIIQRK